ncbi:MAG: D-alanine--D-alanine ligase [Gammaproteobacteria bacterium]|nr:D-alanine--D-alanine ligase [Gammaproteobacteria bacterium]
MQTLTEIVERAGRVVVLMGGHTAERAVSLRSGQAVLEALLGAGVEATAIDWQSSDLEARLRAVRPDRVFIALHGRGGEDGCVQGALEVLGIPYTGSGVLGCALAMDKVRSKQVWLACELPTPPYLVAEGDDIVDKVTATLGWPVIVKPVREGSSIGISIVAGGEDLAGAIATSKIYDQSVLIERFIEGSEYTLAIMGERALPLIKLETPRQFYDYEAKYHANDTRYHCPSGLPAASEAEIATIGLAAFKALGARGWGRVDFMVDHAGQPWLIELNTVPGMTDHSLVPMAARRVGLSMEALVLTILATSFDLP